MYPLGVVGEGGVVIAFPCAYTSLCGVVRVYTASFHRESSPMPPPLPIPWGILLAVLLLLLGTGGLLVYLVLW